jgi:hypothetical protein
MSDKPQQISIWFFIGVLMAIYGVIIFGAGVEQWMNPGEHTVVLAELHVGVWWGAVLVIIGGIYSYVFAPNRTQKQK